MIMDVRAYQLKHVNEWDPKCIQLHALGDYVITGTVIGDLHQLSVAFDAN